MSEEVPIEQGDYMLHPAKVAIFVTALIGMVIAIPATAYASAPSATVTITSQYDDQTTDNLSFRMDAYPAFCDKDSKSGSGTGWTSEVVLTNLAQDTSLDVSFVPNSGGTLSPGDAATFNARGDKANASLLTVTYGFNTKAAAGNEQGSINIPAPQSGCSSTSTSKPDITSYLLNFTPEKAMNSDSSYDVGTVVNLEIALSGSDANSIKTIVYQATVDDGESTVLQNSPSAAIQLPLDQAGIWHIVALLKDGNGNVVSANGDNAVTLHVVSAKVSTPPLTPPVAKPPITVTHTVVTPSVHGTKQATLTARTTSSAAELPMTGINVGRLALGASGILLFGIAVLALGRKRPDHIIDPSWSKMQDVFSK